MKANRSKDIESGRPCGTRTTVFLMLRMSVSGPVSTDSFE
jgi:hypothetical protein